MSPAFWKPLGRAIAAYVADSDLIESAESDSAIERRLQGMLVSLERGEGRHQLLAHPAVVFPHLAETLVTCSPLLDGAMVLFLLDDVSTRHLKQKSIEELLSTLLFSHQICAFKITTEVQTLELILRSPGLIETARAGRDYETFDLGAEVNSQMRKEGKEFIVKILQQRAKYYSSHPVTSPRTLIGDAPLEDIALQIASTGKGARKRKEVYHGLSALAAVCVGDIGDVISIYDLMLRHYRGEPIPASAQSECFQEYCSRRLYHLNRRGGHLKDFALSFADAAYELLVRSHRAAKQGEKPRLRQYNTLYVKVSAGDLAAQFDQLLELMDAGVFVFKGGADSPRTKTRDSNPIQQFILTYRKLFGLSNFIGLANKDRFELSGSDLSDWLTKPANGKEILMRNLGGPLDDAEALAPATLSMESSTKELVAAAEAAEISAIQMNLKLNALESATVALAEDHSEDAAAVDLSPSRTPQVIQLEPEQLAGVGIKSIVIGLGFEERTIESARRLVAIVRPEEVILVRYKDPGYGREIEALIRSQVSKVTVLEYPEILKSKFPELPGKVLVDVTGLSKPIIFNYVRGALAKGSMVVVSHTRAEEYYPLNKDIEEAMQNGRNQTEYERLERVAPILTGEAKPYHFERLLPSDSDESRSRLLCASASAKHERLLSLLDERPFDRIDIVAPCADTARARLARLAADVAAKNAGEAEVVEIDSDDLKGLLEFVCRRYSELYTAAGFDVEIGLTGSKLHCVACAAASSVYKFSQCWYVRPDRFDPNRFTRGVGDTRYFEITLKSDA